MHPSLQSNSNESTLKQDQPLPSPSPSSPQSSPPPAPASPTHTQVPSNAPFSPVEPWPSPVIGHQLLDALLCELSRFVVFPKWAAETFALWIVHTFAFQLRSICTYIAVESPEKECGKSTLLTVLSNFVNRPVVSSNISSSAFFRVIEEFSPTLLIDEADTYVRGSDELRGILNAGYFKPNAFVWRVSYDPAPPTQDISPQPSLPAPGSVFAAPRPSSRPTINPAGRLARFSCWCPKVIASIGRVHDTLASRCIVIPMHRKAEGEECHRLKFLDSSNLKRQCARFALDNADAITSADPAIPPGLTNRAADVWEPLLAIADLAGGRWPELARQAAVGLTTTARDRSPIGALLFDIGVLFIINDAQRLFSRDIVATLNTYTDRPWAELRKGKPLNELWLSTQLRPYGIRPTSIRIGENKGRGYSLDDFKDVFKRYIPRAELETLRKELADQVTPVTEQDQPTNTPSPNTPAANSTALINPAIETQKSKIENTPEHCLHCGKLLRPAPLGAPRPYTHCHHCGTSIPAPSGTSLRENCPECGILQPLHGYNAFRNSNTCPDCGSTLPPLDPKSPHPWLPTPNTPSTN